MRTSFCSADCNNCIKVANERAVKETQNPFAEKINLFSRPGFGFGGDVSKSLFGGIIDSSTSSNTGTTTTNFHATSCWTHSSVFGPCTATTPFDYSATPLHSFKFPPTSKDTTNSDSVWKPTTQPQPQTLPGNENGNLKTQVCNECGAAKASQNPDNEKSSLSPFGIIGSSSNNGTITSTAQPNPNPNQGGIGFCSTQPNKSSAVVSDSGGFGPSNSWTRPSVFGPSKTTTPFDYSATPINGFKFRPASHDTAASVFKPTNEVCYETGSGIITSISAMPANADKSHEQLRFQHYQLQGKPTAAPTVDQFSKSTISAQPQPQLTLPIFVLTMMGSSVGLTQIGTLPTTPFTNGNGITISGSPTFGPPIISGSPTFGSPATVASFGTGPPYSGSSPTLLFGAPATNALSFPQNAAHGDN